MSRPRRERVAVHAVLALDKPVGLSSNAALQRVRGLLGAAKAGHAGTLDPLASGLLPIALGDATKFLHGLLHADKTYEATVRLGVSTETGDAEGAVVQQRPVTHDDAEIVAACVAMVGQYDQVPPMYSALKHAGRPLYDYARANQVVERTARRVTVHALDVLAIDRSHADEPTVQMSVRVSKGTYIRTLAQDIGVRLGCGAHLQALRRTAVAGWSVAQAVALDAFEAMDAAARAACLAPIDGWLGDLPRVALPDALAARFVQGQRLVLDAVQRQSLSDAAAGLVRVYRGVQLLGVAQFVPPGLIAPQRVLATHLG